MNKTALCCGGEGLMIANVTLSTCVLHLFRRLRWRDKSNKQLVLIYEIVIMITDYLFRPFHGSKSDVSSLFSLQGSSG